MGIGKDNWNGTKKCGTLAEGIHGTCADEAFKRFSIHFGYVYPTGKIRNGVKWTVFSPFQNSFNCRTAYIFHCREAESDLWSFNGKFYIGGINVRWKKSNIHPLAFGNNGRNLFIPCWSGIGSGFSRKHCRHVFNRIICFQIRSLVGNHGITCRMRFVKSISGKRFDERKYFFRFCFCQAIFLAPLDKMFTLLFHLGGYFLPDGFAKLIGISPRISGKRNGSKEHIILIGNNSIRLRQYILQSGIRVSNTTRIVFSFNKLRYRLHGARTVQGYHCHKIKNIGGFEFLYVSAHAGGFKLEDARRFCTGKHIICFFVIYGYRGKFDGFPLCFFYVRKRLRKNRKVAKTKEIHFQKSDAVFPYGIHVILCNNPLSFCLFLKRRILHKRFIGNHYPCRMNGRMPGNPFKFFGNINKLLRFRFGSVSKCQFGRYFQCFIKRHLRALHAHRNHPGYPVGFGIGHPKRTACIPDCAFCLHGSKRNNLCNLIVAKFLGNIGNNLITPVIGKIKIDIRSRRTERI